MWAVMRDVMMVASKDGKRADLKDVMTVDSMVDSLVAKLV